MAWIHVTEADGTFRRVDWIAGKVYDFQEILEICWLRQQYIDEFKKLTGLRHGPWVVFNNAWPPSQV